VFTRERMRELRQVHGRKMAKYLAGSVMAAVVSTVTFAVTFGVGLLGSKGASLTASGTGAIANYFLNRNWAWGRRGRADVRKELIPYWRTVIVTAVAAALVTGAVNAVLRDLDTARSLRTLINTVAFVGTYGALFLVKYRLFDRLFAGSARRRHSHEQPPASSVTLPGDIPRAAEPQPVSGMTSATASTASTAAPD